MSDNTSQKQSVSVTAPLIAVIAMLVVTVVAGVLITVFTNRDAPTPQQDAVSVADAPIRQTTRFDESHPLNGVATVCKSAGGQWFSTDHVGWCSWITVRALTYDVDEEFITACHVVNGRSTLKVYTDNDNKTDYDTEIVAVCDITNAEADLKGATG